MLDKYYTITFYTVQVPIECWSVQHPEYMYYKKILKLCLCLLFFSFKILVGDVGRLGGLDRGCDCL